MFAIFSIAETETAWNAFDEDCQSLDRKLTAAEHELSSLQISNTMTFKQMMDMCPRLKVALHVLL